MKAHILLASLAIALTPSFAFAQSATGTNFTTAPAKAPPASGPAGPIGKSKVQIPNAPRSGTDTGLRTGEGAATGESIEVKRIK